MIRPMRADDRERFLTLAHEFYHSDAVLHPISDARLLGSFDYVTAENPYAEGFLVECDGEPAGYAIIAKTYSNEAGGLVLWLEELYLSPRFQGKGLGNAFFSYIEERYRGKVTRIRLEVARGNEGAIRLYGRLGYGELDYHQMFKELNPE